ncbi:MAG: hypothetical protein F4060_10835, partial [Holophagales bacterium]|nr:hypothetical protein [Holophagales bacterium]
EGASGTTATLSFEVTLSAASGQTVTVDYAEGTGTATPSTDYTALTSGTLTFNPGDRSKTIAVTVTGDDLDEPDETIVVELSSPTNATISTSTGTGTIEDDDGAPSLSISSPTGTEGASGATAMLSFEVSLSAASGQTVTVSYAEGTGTATPGEDYDTLTGGTLTFSPGDRTKTIAVTVTGDDLDEPDETVVVELSSPSNATISTGTGTGTIQDDDGAPSLSISSPSVTEGASGTTATLSFEVTLSAASGQTVTVSYAEGTGTATPSTDYTALTSGTLTFNPGDRSKTIAVTVNGDDLDEPDETVVVQLSSPSNATISSATGSGTIQDDDGTPSLSISSPAVTEGASGSTATLSFEVTLSAASGQIVTVSYAEGTGTATPNTDYAALTGGTLTFAPGGALTQAIAVTVAGDDISEPNETVIVELSSPTNATISTGTGTGTIEDDDGTPSLSISSPSVTEGADGATTTLSFDVTLSAASGQTVTVEYAEGTGTATPGEDYTPLTAGSLTFSPGDQTQTVNVTVTGDDVDEPDETVVVELSSPTNATISTATGTGTIHDDDGTPSLSISSPSVTEGADGTTTTLSFEVILSTSSGQTVTVSYAEGTGTATPNTDYTALTGGTLTFAPGDALTQTIAVTVTGDDIDELDETVVVELSSPTNAAISTATGTGTIRDDDGAPSISIDSPMVMEGADGETGVLEFQVTLSGTSDQPITVAYALGTGTATAGDDFMPLSAGMLTFAPGERSKTISVMVSGDDLDELDETVVIELSSATNADIATGTGTGTIADDDSLAVSIGSPSVTEGAAGESATMTFEVTLSEISTLNVTVDYAEGGGTATPGEDYTAVASGTLTFPPGDTSRTIDVTVLGDNDAEPDETVVIELSGPTNAPLGVATGTGTITNDDGGEPPPPPPPPGATLSIGSPSVVEPAAGETAVMTFEVTLSEAAAGAVTVDFAPGAGTATPGTDYEAVSGGTVTFAQGDTSRAIDVTVFGDEEEEEDETVVIVLSNAQGAPLGTAVGTGTITTGGTGTTPAPPVIPAPPPEVSIDSPSVGEGDEGEAPRLEFTVTLSEMSVTPVTVDWRPAADSGTATAGEDYAPVTGGTVTFAAFETEQMFAIAVIGDDFDEPTETVIIELSNPRDATLAEAVGTGRIRDDDGRPELLIGSPSVAEGEAGATSTLTFPVTLSVASGRRITVSWAPADDPGTATAGEDYDAFDGGVLAFEPGETSKSIEVTVTGDNLDEPDETVIVELSNASWATLGEALGTGTITNDDEAPLLSIGSANVEEGDDGDTPALVLTVTLSEASGREVTVAWGPAEDPGTATAGTDYETFEAGTLLFEPGETSKSVEVTVLGDVLDEADETVIVELSDASGARIGEGSGTGTGTIMDDDETPMLSIAAASVEEGDDGDTPLVFTVTLSEASGREVTVHYSESGAGTATVGEDYKPLDAGVLTFQPGDALSQTIEVTVLGDYQDEPDETVIVQLADAAGAVIENRSAAGVIVDDDIGLGQVQNVVVEEHIEALFLAWEPVDLAHGYKVQWRSGDETWDARTRQDRTNGNGTTSVWRKPMKAGKEYTLRVIATRKGELDGPPSDEVTGTPKSKPPPNLPPTADAGPDQVLGENTAATLDGSGSRDPEGATLTFAWSQVSGPRVTLDNSAAVAPAFTTPASLARDADLVFSLVVSDGVYESEPDEVVITVESALPKRRGDALKFGLAAFGRSVAAMQVDAISERAEEVGEGQGGGSMLTLAGRQIDLTNGSGSASGSGAASPNGPAGVGGFGSFRGFPSTAVGSVAGGSLPGLGLGGPGSSSVGGPLSDPFGVPFADGFSRAMGLRSRAMRDLFGNSSFEWRPGSASHGAAGPAVGAGLPVAEGADEAGERGNGRFSLWGRGDLTRFQGAPGEGFRMSGEVLSALTGLEYRVGQRLFVGLSMQHGDGIVDYSLENFEDGRLNVGLTSVQPYVHWSSTNGRSAWSVFGRGAGAVELRDEHGSLDTDLDSEAAAAGVRTELARIGSAQLALKADAFAVRIDAAATDETPAVAAEANRARVLLESEWTLFPSEGRELRLGLEIGGRLDGGDAEESLGAELGGEIGWRNPDLGLEISGRGWMLLAHEDSAYEDWNASATLRWAPRGDAERGLSIALTPIVGAETGSFGTLWRDDRLFQSLASRGQGGGALNRGSRRMDLEVGYGLRWGPHGSLRPLAEVSWGDLDRRHYRLGLTGRRSESVQWRVAGEYGARSPGTPGAFGMLFELRLVPRW